MNLYKAIIIVFIFITPLKANTIYNLIKIPNLEIYEINTKNKLRYVYATKPFKLGLNIEKNISCYHSDKKLLHRKYKIINKNLNRYSSNFFNKINLKYIVLCENLSIGGIKTAGIPAHTMRTLILDVKFNEEHFERAIHHEVFHIINDNFKEFFDRSKWKNFNKKDFTYSKCSTCNNKWNLELYELTNGFLTEYSKTTSSEDMAEIFSHLMLYKGKFNTKDPIIKEKILFIKKNILKIDNTFKF